ncbi:hypothetical protein [Sphingobium yanoikuyae]|jgi:hypothetical protein|uniref:hypothetical protein n=1 Tax=Sphingobium yanoikuyae TaxID=13690 RepID=UPI0028ADF963|nr:hypothetical protein [Sphingobium yanoikuyae]
MMMAKNGLGNAHSIKAAVGKVMLLGICLLPISCSAATPPYYLDCDGKLEYGEEGSKRHTLDVHWAFLIDEEARDVRGREGEYGAYVSMCEQQCDGVKISSEFVEWTSKVIDTELPDFVSHTHTQINRKTGQLAGLTWVGKDRAADLNPQASWAVCKRSSKPPKARN